ncbi:membrane-associated protein VIPP1, chloroplastic isoform X2 [Arabidopsis lyrata subsp. lyrata]|uniref:membrane-associated protein VIPP1, chloroplastic isoform X2 n=1 Tax=Arabidopsis lyrata subsp. lyrata TaxID=81972 RepID=UPI000A29BB30|nr:membrane-associated protein VIPP1, chloroplastic isoform X2 [Arabidopsis lyrata subsp. lyrata]|eukprot:XP_020865582.1 membrane-associated protein VIPP1, chloroplastic isoform X2 [Arabidopsis lyrata subsp. lyrata]
MELYYLVLALTTPGTCFFKTSTSRVASINRVTSTCAQAYEIAIEMALKASPVAGLFPPLRPTASSSPSTSNRPCSLRVLPLRPSFFGGALRVNVLRLACANRLRCNGHGATMNLFERFSRVVKSYANALISSFEDPEKILEQTVIEKNSDLTKMRQATAQVQPLNDESLLL